jgi:hypothetical protein
MKGGGKLERNGTTQEGYVRAVERRKHKMRRRNKQNICRKLGEVGKCENYVENGKGEKRVKNVKKNKQRTED